MALSPDIQSALTLPAVCAPMFLCSGVDLAVESCKAGIIGSLTRNNCRDVEELGAQLGAVTEGLARFASAHPDRKIGPLAVNIEPKYGDDETRAHIDLCRRYGVKIIITSVGNPAGIAPVIKDAGILHFHDATSIRFAEKAIAAEVDGIIAIGSGGGGHAGTVSHLVLVPQIRQMFDGTIVLAGAVSTGAAIRAAEILGADLAYLGTRFIATRESLAPRAHKQMLLDAGASDVIYTRGVNGLPASWLKESIRALGLDPDNLPLPEGRSTDHLPSGKAPWRDIWSGGQGVQLIHEIPAVAELVRQLQAEYIEACARPDMADAAREALEG